MNTHIRKRLEQLRADYESVSDRPWHFFYCPILHRDEETELCAGHIINQALEDVRTARGPSNVRMSTTTLGHCLKETFLALERKVANFKSTRFWPTRRLALANSNLEIDS